MDKHKNEQGTTILSFFSSLENVVIAILLCSLVILPNYINAQITPNTPPSNQGTLPNPAQTLSEQPETGMLNTATIIIPQGAATEQRFVDYYEPSPGLVYIGQEIIWNNQDSTTHTAVADDGSFNTGEIQPGFASSAIIIQSYGEYAYHCVIHPHMTGFLEVIPSRTQIPRTIEQELLEIQHLRLTEQSRLQQIQAIAASPPPEQRLVAIASVQNNAINSINFLKELLSMQPQQQVTRLQELLLQIQQSASSQLQGQPPTIGEQLIQTAIALDPVIRDLQFLITWALTETF
jgi:plastocyanin